MFHLMCIFILMYMQRFCNLSYTVLEATHSCDVSGVRLVLV